MAYSRWGDSYWYTYWCIKPKGEVETRDNARFDICAIATFTAKELRENMEMCISHAREVSRNNTLQPYESDYEVLRECMNEFLEEVDEKYPLSADVLAESKGETK